ncbi:MAG TPA: SUMF1/EgtB/PvdO family nonheme iron enzyme [Planctomycetota bacterium]|nr:SUMF1/EgtB/PvdO family nonheme iron enzyme [Planctomycetota bacterium]
MKRIILFFILCSPLFAQEQWGVSFLSVTKTKEEKQLAASVQKNILTLLPSEQILQLSSKKSGPILQKQGFWKNWYRGEMKEKVKIALQKANVHFIIIMEFKTNKNKMASRGRILNLQDEKASAGFIFKANTVENIQKSWIEKFQSSSMNTFFISRAHEEEASKNIAELAQEQLSEQQGWFGETMPNGLTRSTIPGEYIWKQDGSIMVYVPAGEFIQGKDETTNEAEDELPIRTVHLPAYYIDKYEVTNEQYASFLNAIQEKDKIANYIDIESEYSQIKQESNEYKPLLPALYLPVVKISWLGAQQYAEWAGKTLPTESQWEKAARGGKMIPQNKYNTIPLQLVENTNPQRMYPWGNEPFDQMFVRANAKSTFPKYVQELEGLGDSPYGCVHMAGNVWEWCQDSYVLDAYTKLTENPEATIVSDAKVCRGGSWGSDAHAIRCSYRYGVLPEKMHNDLGFRCVLIIKE